LETQGRLDAMQTERAIDGFEARFQRVEARVDRVERQIDGPGLIGGIIAALKSAVKHSTFGLLKL
jgi:hypothetical protein